MALLNVDQQYILHGGPAPREKEERPDVLHVRLSNDLLTQLLSEGKLDVSIANVTSNDPILSVNDVQHALQRSVEASPHHLFRLGSSSSPNSPLQQLDLVGHVQTKLVVRQNASSTTSASLRLKERREEEAARKSEHRAVLLSSAPVTSSKKKPASSSLKLRAKGLAPSSPLIRSRAVTPAESTALSGPASEKDLNGKTSSPLKREGSPTGLRQALVQLLAAKGPLSKREIVQSVQFAEAQVMLLLPRVAHAPEHLQNKKFSGPVNRRSTGSLGGTTSSVASEGGTVFALKDSAWQEVLIKDWEQFDVRERMRLSETMEAVLDSLKVAKNADCRLQIVRERAPKLKQESNASSEEVSKPASSTSSAKRPTTKERLARAAKGKNLKSSAASTPSSKAVASAAKRATPQQAPSHDPPASTAAMKKSKRNVSLEYTDSEAEEEEEEVVVKQVESRPRQGVGKGANLVKEPWLDVRSIREWHELAKRFRRTYGEYQTNLGRVQDEEIKVRSEIEQARIEEQHQLQNQQQPQRRNSIRATRTSRSSDAAKADVATALDDEREEGEADSGEPAPLEPYSWRTAKVSGGEPMPLEEMDALVTTVLELEGQLRRMKNALQDSKKSLV